LRVVGESPGEFVNKLMKDMLSGQTQSALFERGSLFKRFGISKGTPSILLVFDFGNNKLDINL
jgi:hypothetical protein